MTSKNILLPVRDNFYRLKECDFNLSSIDKDYRLYQTGNSRIPVTLKNITNPILILILLQRYP